MDKVQCDRQIYYLLFHSSGGKKWYSCFVYSSCDVFQRSTTIVCLFAEKLGGQFTYHKLVNPKSSGRHYEVSHKILEA